MTIYISYYANWRKFPKDSVLVQISRTAPRDSVSHTLDYFMPSQDLLQSYKNGNLDEEEYKRRYLKQLNSLSEDNINIMFLLKKQMDDTNTILLCYEGKDKFCHRHILAEWLNENYGFEIKELDNSD